MLPYFGWIIAIVSIALCIAFWFRDVSRIMSEQTSTVESAARQLSSCRKKVERAQDDTRAWAVYERSKKIYFQAVQSYNHTLKKPRIFLPAMLMGYKFM